MEDIERHHFWHSEMDAHIKQVNESKIKTKIIDDSLTNLKLDKPKEMKKGA